MLHKQGEENTLSLHLLIKSSLQLPAPQERTGDYCPAASSTGLPNPFLHSSYLESQSSVYFVVWGYYNPGAWLWFVLVEINEVPVDPCFQPMKAPQNDSPTFWHMSHSSNLLLFDSLLDAYLILLVIKEEFKQYQPPSSATGTQLPVGLWTSDH